MYIYWIKSLSKCYEIPRIISICFLNTYHRPIIRGDWIKPFQIKNRITKLNVLNLIFISKLARSETGHHLRNLNSFSFIYKAHIQPIGCHFFIPSIFILNNIFFHLISRIKYLVEIIVKIHILAILIFPDEEMLMPINFNWRQILIAKE